MSRDVHSRRRPVPMGVWGRKGKYIINYYGDRGQDYNNNITTILLLLILLLLLLLFRVAASAAVWIFSDKKNKYSITLNSLCDSCIYIYCIMNARRIVLFSTLDVWFWLRCRHWQTAVYYKYAALDTRGDFGVEKTSRRFRNTVLI